MKGLFEINDDWDNENEMLNFETKSSKKKSKKKATPEVKKLSNSNGALSRENVLEVPSEPKAGKAAKKEKKKKSKLHSEEYEYDGVCKFTPLLKKNLIHNQNIEFEQEPPSDTKQKKKKNKKRKLENDEDQSLNEHKKAKIHNKQNKTKKNADKTQDEVPEIAINLDFANKLREQLSGGRFRFINEQLYTTTGNEAKKLFEKDKDAFKSYHSGYRQQYEKWPFNPLDRLIKRVRKMPKHLVIADFGCGEAKLAESIPNKCYSLDLVSAKPGVIACDMAHTPLKSDSVDVAIFCLSLMGTNLSDFIAEANRVLKKDGTVYVAEIASRFDKIKDFQKLWEHLGFQLLRQDVDKKNYFYFFDFRKTENVKKNLLRVANCKLKPCIYKKR